MYESDEWYVQYDVSKKTTNRANSNTNHLKSSPSANVNENELGWDLGASASDNESIEIETDGSQID